MIISKTGSKNGQYRVMLLFAFTIAFLLHLLAFATAPMVTVVMKEMGLSHADFGVIYSAIMVSFVVFRIPWGLISDRIGYQKALRVALPLAAAAAVLRAVSPSYTILLLSQFCLGLGLAAVFPCLALIVKEWSPSRAYGVSTGIYMSGFAVGNATALGLTPHLLEIMVWRGVLLVYGGLAIVVSGLWWRFARSAAKGTSEFQVRNFAGVLKDRYVWALLLLMIASMGSYDTLATWLPKVLETRELNKMLASLLPLGFLLAGPTVGLVWDRFRNRKTIVTLLGGMAAVAIMGISYAPGSLLPLCIFLTGFATTGAVTPILAVAIEHERLSASLGGVVGFVTSLANVGPLVMVAVFGFLIDITSTFHASLWAVTALASIIFILGPRV